MRGRVRQPNQFEDNILKYLNTRSAPDLAVYEFNILVSTSWATHERARDEIIRILSALGDEDPVVTSTAARGILGVKTSLDARQVIGELRKLFEVNPARFQYTLKWVPVDSWTSSDINSIKARVSEIKSRIGKGETWRITVEKRRYTRYHKSEIIKETAAGLIDEKVDLENPDKILRIDLIAKYAGISVLTPKDIFSVAKPYT